MNFNQNIFEWSNHVSWKQGAQHTQREANLIKPVFSEKQDWHKAFSLLMTLKSSGFAHQV